MHQDNDLPVLQKIGSGLIRELVKEHNWRQDVVLMDEAAMVTKPDT